MAATLPELGSGGWVTEPMKQLDLLLAHAMESDYSQSTIYFGNITSIPYLFQKFQHDPGRLCSELENMLSAYLSRYFDTVSVRCTTEDKEDNKYDLYISGTVKRKGLSYELAKVVDLENNRMRYVAEVNNR
jgi:hypothetical protein